MREINFYLSANIASRLQTGMLVVQIFFHNKTLDGMKNQFASLDRFARPLRSTKADFIHYFMLSAPIILN
jgi:hypothetical protein